MNSFDLLKPDMVGKKFQEARFKISSQWVQNYKKALGFGEKEVLDNSYVPQTFVACLRDSEFGAFETLGIDLSQLLHGSQNYRFFGDFQVDDVITCQCEIQRLLRKKGKAGDLVFIEFRNLFRRIARKGVNEQELGGVPVLESLANVVVRERTQRNLGVSL
jgi:hypothetical protein